MGGGGGGKILSLPEGQCDLKRFFGEQVEEK